MRASLNTELFSRNVSAVLPPIQLSYMLNGKARSSYFHITVGPGTWFGDVLGRSQLQRGLCLRLRFFPTSPRVQLKKELRQWSDLPLISKAEREPLCPGWGFPKEWIRHTRPFVLSGGKQHRFTQTHSNLLVPYQANFSLIAGKRYLTYHSSLMSQTVCPH